MNPAQYQIHRSRMEDFARRNPEYADIIHDMIADTDEIQKMAEETERKVPVPALMLNKAIALLGEARGRFRRLDEAGDAASRYNCWSVAHSMDDDIRMALGLLTPPAEPEVIPPPPSATRQGCET